MAKSNYKGVKVVTVLPDPPDFAGTYYPTEDTVFRFDPDESDSTIINVKLIHGTFPGLVPDQPVPFRYMRLTDTVMGKLKIEAVDFLIVFSYASASDCDDRLRCSMGTAGNEPIMVEYAGRP